MMTRRVARPAGAQCARFGSRGARVRGCRSTRRASRHHHTREHSSRSRGIDIDQPIAASAQGGADWRLVTGVKAGADTRVILDNWKTHRGRFQGADERSVTLEIGGVSRTFERAQVREVGARGGSRAGNAKAWAAVGMLGGLAAGVASCRGREAECAQAGRLATMIGSIAGAIFGATRASWTPIYAVR